MIDQIPDFLRRTEKADHSRFGVEHIQVTSMKMKGKSLGLTKVKFDDVDKCKSFVKGLMGKDKIVDHSDEYTTATLSSGIRISTNYSLELILKGVQPTEKLRNIWFDSRDIAKNVGWKMTTPEVKSKSRGGTNVPTGNLIPIKQICKDNDIEPRVARAKLRSSKDPLIEGHRAKGRWEFRKEDVEKVLSIIKGEK